MIENIAAVLIGIIALGLGSMALRGLFRLTIKRHIDDELSRRLINVETIQLCEENKGAVYATFVPRTQVPMEREDRK